MSFVLHAQLAADTLLVGDLDLCRVLMMNDSQYPWFILVPRRAEIREIMELSDAERTQLWQESDWLSRELMCQFKPDKLNIAALGNMVPQLHIHHIARFKIDPAWPAPVWGKHPAQAYAPELAQQRLQAMQLALKL